MQEKIEEYADALAAYLGTLGCYNGAIAHGLLKQMRIGLRPRLRSLDYPLKMALTERVTAAEKDCPGWAALPADQKDRLRKLGAGEKTVP